MPVPSNPVDTAEDLVATLEALGVRLWQESGQLHFRAPAGVMTEERVAALRQSKQEVLDHLRMAEQGLSIQPDPAGRYKPFPLTDVQAAYLLGRRAPFDYGNCPCQVYGEMAFAELDPRRLEEAWRALVARHDMLRAVIDQTGHQRILERVPDYRIAVTDASGSTTTEFEVQVEKARTELDHRFYEPDRWPLFCLRITLGPKHAVLHFSIDFLIADYLSIQRLLAELRERYRVPGLSTPTPKITFRDYVLGTRGLRESGRYERDRDYWLSRIDDLPAAPELPVIEQRQDARTARFRRLQMALGTERSQSLRRRANNHQITPTGAVLAAYAEVIGRWSRRPHFTLNLTLLNRQQLHPEVEQLVGDFTTVSLLAIDRGAGKTFGTRAACLLEQRWQDMDHRLFSGVEVMRELARRRGRAAALMPVIFTSTIGLAEEGLDSSPADADDAQQDSQDDAQAFMSPTLVYGISQTPQVWIDCQAIERGDELVVSWDVRDGIFPPGVVDQMFAAMETLLTSLADDDQTWALESPVSLPAEQHERRSRVNATERPISPALLQDGILAQALSDPQRAAVSSFERTVSYEELLCHAVAVRNSLLSAGCAPGERVAITMEKGWEQVAGILGTLLAGAAYVPLDTLQPPARREEMLRVAAARLVLTQSSIDLDFPDESTLIAVDRLTPATPTEVAEAASSELRSGRQQVPQDLAYVIFTSGSTGVPKGVMISHRSALNTIEDVNERFGVGPEDRVLGLAHLGFDLSVYDIFGPLIRGGCLVLPDAARRGDPSHWAEVVAVHEVSVWNSVPAQLQMLEHYLRATPGTELHSLRLAMLSGDWIPVALPDAIRARIPQIELVSLGGATEAAIWSIFHRIDEVPADWRSIPYGKPLANQSFHVFDHALQPCPDWTAGELYIGGVGVALGYLGDPEKTAERFIDHPTGERLYRTGDFGRYLPDGSIEFLGREDRQVKIRGHRIELAEVEAALLSHPGVASAVALVDERSALDRQLAAFVEPAIRDRSEDRTPEIASDLSAAAAAAGEAVASRDDAEHFVRFVRELDRVALLEIMRALRTSGLFGSAGDAHTPDEVLGRALVADRHHRLVQRWLSELEQEGLLLLEPDTGRYRIGAALQEADLDTAWREAERLLANGGYGQEVTQYLRRSSERLPELIRGEEDPLRLLFPEGRLDTAQAAYGDYPIGRYTNATVAATVKQLAQRAEATGRLRILEVGAGVGGTSVQVISALEELDVEYHFSDVSQFFLNEARERFSRCPWVSYRTFDLNVDYRAQGLQPSSFDVIVAANVLHYAEHVGEVLGRLCELLTSGGWLVFVEATRNSHWIMASMELMEAEREFRDSRHASHETFLGHGQWMKLLQEAGADATVCLPEPDHPLAAVGQQMYAVRFKGDRVPLRARDLECHLATRLPEYMIPRQLQVVETLPLSHNGKLDHAELRRWLPREQGERVDHGGEPQDDLERRLAELWAEMLGVARVGRDQDFFELGGDSLLISQVTARILETVPEANGLFFDQLMLQMLDAPRVEALAAHLREHPTLAPEIKPDRPRSQLVPLAGTEAPAESVAAASILIHDELGVLAHYGSLARALSRHGPVFGLNAPETRMLIEVERSLLVERLASEYARLVGAGVSGPLRVVGHSAGAVIGIELARALAESGKQVEELVLIAPSRATGPIEDDLTLELAFAQTLGIDPASLGFPTDDAALALAFGPQARAGGAPAAGRGTNSSANGGGTAEQTLPRLLRRPKHERLAGLMRAAAASHPELDASGELGECFERFCHLLCSFALHEPDLYAGDLTVLQPAESRWRAGRDEDAIAWLKTICLGEMRVEQAPVDAGLERGGYDIEQIAALICPQQVPEQAH
jgi:L-cysteine---[L-cysteinyl-carrier protein] ligase PchF